MLSGRELLAMDVGAIGGVVTARFGVAGGSAAWRTLGHQPNESWVPDVDLALTAAPGEVPILPGRRTQHAA